jgi:undecaprenol kinase
MINLKQFKKSFSHALRGVSIVFKEEQSFRIQTIAAIVAVALSLYLEVNQFELLLILLMIGSVMTLELINSIIERLVDSFKPRIHPVVKEIKDIMAGAVLFVSTLSLIIGILIFYPYISRLLV